MVYLLADKKQNIQHRKAKLGLRHFKTVSPLHNYLPESTDKLIFLYNVPLNMYHGQISYNMQT